MRKTTTKTEGKSIILKVGIGNTRIIEQYYIYSMEDMTHRIDQIKTREDFVSFLELLLNDFKYNSKEWENQTLESYLEAMGRWTEDMDGYYKNMNLEMPKNVDWKVFANILATAKKYE